MKPEQLCGSTRLVVTLNASFGFFVILLVRVQFSISILCMVADRTSNVTTGQGDLSNASLSLDVASSNVSTSAIEIDLANSEECGPASASHCVTSNRQGDFEWDKPLQGLLLSAFFWGYVTTQIPFGWLAGRLGPKHIISVAMFIANLAHILTPLAATWSPYLVIALRIIMGMGHGAMFPGLHSLFGRWAPPMERSVLMAPTYAAGIIAACVAMGLTGVLCDLIGWQMIFYSYGILSYIYLLLWCYNVYNTPARHPRITTEEKTYIQTAIGPGAYAKKAATPWGAILLSGPAWAINVAHFCDNWGNYTLLISAPLYMKEVLRFDIKSNGLLMSVPYLVMYVTAVACSPAADWLRRNHVLSTTHVRKLFQTIGFIVPAVFIVSLGFVPCSQRALAVTLLTLCVAFQAFCRVGYSINHVDIAPRFSGLLSGLSNTIANVPGMVSPYLAAALTPNGRQEEWRLVFLVCGAVYLFGTVVYLLLGSGEEQPWARPEGDADRKMEMDVTLPLSDAGVAKAGELGRTDVGTKNDDVEGKPVGDERSPMVKGEHRT